VTLTFFFLSETQCKYVTFDHADVVGAVADGERDALAMCLDEVDDE